MGSRFEVGSRFYRTRLNEFRMFADDRRACISFVKTLVTWGMYQKEGRGQSNELEQIEHSIKPFEVNRSFETCSILVEQCLKKVVQCMGTLVNIRS